MAVQQWSRPGASKLNTWPRLPSSLAGLPGLPELSLSGAVVLCGPEPSPGATLEPLEDIGLGLVLSGEYAAAAEVLDLGSGRLQTLDLSGSLRILDWVGPSVLEYAVELAKEIAPGQSGANDAPRDLLEFCHTLALQLLRKVGFSPIHRPTLFRLGFRDLVRDLDYNESAAVRIETAPGEITSFRCDYENFALVVDQPPGRLDPSLEATLRQAFPAAEVRRVRSAKRLSYELRFPLPFTLVELRSLVASMRLGFLELIARFEPHRFESLTRSLDTFGERDFLKQIDTAGPGYAEAPPARRRRWARA